jgi:protein-disulfide isomerase
LARVSQICLLFFVLFTLLGAGCKAQAAPDGALSSELKHRIASEIRSRYKVPPQVDVAISDAKPGEIQGYDKVVVTLSAGGHSSDHDLLLSKDRKTLAQLDKFDISQDPMSKIEVKDRPVRGNSNAKIEIVNFDDFECPFCSRMHGTLFPGLLKSYGDRVKFIYKDYPLVEIHPWAMHAAIDGNCLAAQNNDAYWDFADYVHGNQKQVGGTGPAQAFENLDKAARSQASKHSLDSAKLDACMKKQDETSVRASMAEGDKLGVDSTPTMFVNGEKLEGAVPEDQLRAILDRALADAGEKPGTPNNAVPQAKK